MAEPPPAPRTIADGRYELLAPLGRGGMGEVYRALDRRLGGRVCAVKLLAGAGATGIARARFIREVELTAQLTSPHIVKMIDTGVTADGRPYLVMELLNGRSLDALLSQTARLAPPRAVALADGILLGLAVAHTVGIVHRDIKPANVFLAADEMHAERPVLLDFGIARPYQGDAQGLTGRGTLLGTPRYMAPEQIEHGRIDGRSDLYAVGMLLAVMLAGRHPFDGLDSAPLHVRGARQMVYLWHHLHTPPAPIGGVSDALERVVARLRARDPEARFGSATDAMQALRATPEGAGLPALDPRRVEALAPKTVPVDIHDFDLDVPDDPHGTPNSVEAVIDLAPPPPRATGWPAWATAIGLALAIVVTGGLVYAFIG